MRRMRRTGGAGGERAHQEQDGDRHARPEAGVGLAVDDRGRVVGLDALGQQAVGTVLDAVVALGPQAEDLVESALAVDGVDVVDARELAAACTTGLGWLGLGGLDARERDLLALAVDLDPLDQQPPGALRQPDLERVARTGGGAGGELAAGAREDDVLLRRSSDNATVRSTGPSRSKNGEGCDELGRDGPGLGHG